MHNHWEYTIIVQPCGLIQQESQAIVAFILIQIMFLLRLLATIIVTFLLFHINKDQLNHVKPIAWDLTLQI